MAITFQLTEGEKWKRSLRIEVSADEVKDKFEETYRKIKAEAQIPGFRPGRVPLTTIKSRFGDLAKRDVFEDLVQESYKEAISQAKLDPVSYPKFTEVDFDEDKPLIYTAELEVKPVIVLERYTGLALQRPNDQVKEGEVKELIEYLQRKNATLEEVERPAAEKDFVFADLEVLSDSGGNIKQEKFADVQLELAEGNVAGQFTKQLIGIKTDDQKEVEINYPQDHFDKRFAGSLVKFLVRIKGVKELHLAELNEEFFKNFGAEIITFDQLKEKIRGDLQVRKKKDADDALKNEVIKEVIDKNRFDLPESLVERFLDGVVEDFRKERKEEVDEAQLRENYRPVAIRQIRWDFLMAEIAKKENIKVEQPDIDGWLQRFADNYKMTLEEAKETLAKHRKIADLKESILESKVIEFITSGSTVETVFSPLVKPE